MNKLISMIAALALLAGLLTACSATQKPQKQEENQRPSATEASKGQNSETPATTTTATDNAWGKWDRKSIKSSQGLIAAEFKWPVRLGDRAYTGVVGRQDDGTVVLVDNYVPDQSPEIDDIEDVFPAYFEQTAKNFEVYYRGDYSNGSFTIESKENVKIGDREFLKLTGQHKYQYDAEGYSDSYVIYLTEMEAPGAYIYCLVSDATDDQSAGALMADHAYKIASSIRAAED